MVDAPAAAPRCRWCRALLPVTPRPGRGGRQKEFCKPSHRVAWHKAEAKRREREAAGDGGGTAADPGPARCRWCGALLPVTPRPGRGGRQKEFCTPSHRVAWHQAEARRRQESGGSMPGAG
jgi:hypothetical protein